MSAFPIFGFSPFRAIIRIAPVLSVIPKLRLETTGRVIDVPVSESVFSFRHPNSATGDMRGGRKEAASCDLYA